MRAEDRRPSLDVVRAVATALFIPAFFVVAVADTGGQEAYQRFLGTQLFGAWPPALFLFASGASLALVDDQARRSAWRRGLTLMVLGWALEAACLGPEFVFLGGLLPLIGAGVVCVRALDRLPGAAFALLAAGLVLAAPPLREAAGYAELWGPFARAVGMPERWLPVEVFAPTWGRPLPPEGFAAALGAAPLKFVLTGAYPAAPWLAFAFLGHWAGRRLARPAPVFHLDLAVVGVLLVIAGLGLSVSSMRTPDADFAFGLATSLVTPLSLRPLTPSAFALLGGAALTGLAVLAAALDPRGPERRSAFPVPDWALAPFQAFSRLSLTVTAGVALLIHLPAHALHALLADPGRGIALPPKLALKIGFLTLWTVWIAATVLAGWLGARGLEALVRRITGRR